MQEDQHSLKSGLALNNYTIIRVLGEGGFGITYLAKDNELGLEVVIKEYFPNEFAMRTQENTITAKSKSVSEFKKGKQRFKEEAQTLDKFNHPSIVKILGYFEANNTAYFVMEYEEGIDLSQYLKQENRTLGQEEILSIMMPILEGLKEVHKYNYLHRDIKPGNILLRNNKAPVLIDFGASKLAFGEASKSVTSMLTEGYAPLEQYSTDIKQQGAFTDIYAVGAVIYKMITNEAPPSAQSRSYALLSDGKDLYAPLVSLGLMSYRLLFLQAVDRALLLNGKDRPQTIFEFQASLLRTIEKVNFDKKLAKRTESIQKIIIEPSFNDKEKKNVEQLEKKQSQFQKLSSERPSSVFKRLKYIIIIILLTILFIHSRYPEYFDFFKSRSIYLSKDEVDKKINLYARMNQERVQRMIDGSETASDGIKQMNEEFYNKTNKKHTSKKNITVIGSKMWEDEPYSNEEIRAFENSENYKKVQSWYGAFKYCKNLTLGGYTDWRLPTKVEWHDLDAHKRSINNYILRNFWSSPVVGSRYAWQLFLDNKLPKYNRDKNWERHNYNGLVYYSIDKTEVGFVRCVRNKHKLNF